MTRRPDPPPATGLNYEQYSGRACCWCGIRLWRGAVSAGIARGRIGAVVLDNEVFACPDHVNGPTPEPNRRGGDQ